VFVVEQRAAYPELDGRDLERGCVHFWAEDESDAVIGALRLLDDGTSWRIGRVVAAPAARGRGVARELMRRALEAAQRLDPERDIVLDAQEPLADWYGRFGFVVAGSGFLEDDIPHVPMRRAGERSATRR
jgi:ElaA protein